MVPFAQFLVSSGVEIISSSGTAEKLIAAGIPVRQVSDFTGFPEMMGGRIKTLHPKVHGGILNIRTDADHQHAMAEHAIQPIDLVVVNLYPFETAVAKGLSIEECIGEIDIGGPAMIRSAAKNQEFVTVVVNKNNFELVMDDMRKNKNETSQELRWTLALQAFELAASYDTAIANFFRSHPR